MMSLFTLLVVVPTVVSVSVGAVGGVVAGIGEVVEAYNTYQVDKIKNKARDRHNRKLARKKKIGCLVSAAN